MLSRRSLVKQVVVGGALFVPVLPIGRALARETYAQYAERIVSQPPDGAEFREDLERAVLMATNSYRKSKRITAFKPGGDMLRLAARAHAADLMAQNAMGHVAGTGHDFAARMRAFYPGQMFPPAMAENAARLRNSDLDDAAKAKALVEQWIKSPGHRHNLVGRDFIAMAVGVISRGRDVYAVQIFSGPQVKTNGMFGNSSG
jgi:uncharacterized protein YkwD